MNSVRDLLDELGVAYREHGQSSHVTPGWLGIVCPVPGCGQGGKFGRGIHARSLKTTCWKCGPARLGDVLALASGRPLAEILGRVKSLLPDYEDSAPANPRGRYQPPVGVGPLLPVHRRYLERRGFDPDELADVWGVRGVGKDGPHRWRVVFPVCDRTGPVSWTARAVGPDVTPRYLSAPPDRERDSAKHHLFGWQHVRHAVAVTEGVFGACRIGPGAAATLGVAYTPAQLARIASVPVRLIVFDSDAAGQARARKLADDLAPYPGTTTVVTLSGPDPDTSPDDEIAELRRMLA